MTPSTLRRIGRLYAAWIGYDAIAEGTPPDFALLALHYNRETAVQVCGDHPEGGFADAMLADCLDREENRAEHRRVYHALRLHRTARHDGITLTA